MPQIAIKREDGIATKIRRLRLFQPRLCDAFTVNRYGIDRASVEKCSYDNASTSVWIVAQVMAGASFFFCALGIMSSLLAYFTNRLKWMRKTIGSFYVVSCIFECAWMGLLAKVHSNAASSFEFPEYDRTKYSITVVYDVGFYFALFAALFGIYGSFLSTQVSSKSD